jgi:hypothetical protein
MFLGGVERRLADAKSNVAFHSGYGSTMSTPTPGQYGRIGRLLTEMTGGKLSDALAEIILQKRRNGFVYFYRDRTYNCDGTEPKRPSGCEQLPQTAMAQGILTSLGDVTVIQVKLDELPITSEHARAEYGDYLEETLPKAFAISPDKSHFAWGSTAQGTTEAINRALTRCAEAAGAPCRLYAVDNEVVWKESQ